MRSSETPVISHFLASWLEAFVFLHLIMKRAPPALAVPAGESHIWSLVLRKWKGGRILCLPCAAQLVREFSGWTFQAYNFQKAVEAASSAQGGASLLLLRNMTLLPISSIYEGHIVYSSLKDAKDLTIESCGGPWRIRLHRGGGIVSAPRYLMLTYPRSAVTFRNFFIKESVGAECELNLRLTFSPVGVPVDLVYKERPVGGCTSSLASYRLLGGSLRRGDMLIVTSRFVHNLRILNMGTKGTVTSTSLDECGQTFTVLWTGETDVFSLSHARNTRFDVLSLSASAASQD